MSETAASSPGASPCTHALRRHADVVRAIADSVAILATTTSPLDVIPRLLATLGEAFGVERIVVLEAPEGAHAIVPRFQWTAPGVSAIDPSFFARVPSENADIRAWLAPLAQGRPVIVTAATATPTVAGILSALALQSILLMPIFVEGRLWGHLGLDSADPEHSWNAWETDTLRLLAQLIGSAIQRDRRRHLLLATTEELKFSNVLLRAIMDISPNGIVVADRDQRIAWTNRRFADMWNLSLAQIEGGVEPVLNAVVGQIKDADEHLRLARHLLAHPNETRQDDFELKDGRVLDRYTTGLYGVDRRYLGRVWFFRDITEQRRQAARLAFSNILLNATTESSPDGILVVDANAKIISSNRRFAEMWKIPSTLIDAQVDEPVLQTVAVQVKDLDRFLARIRHLYDHPDETGHDEIELKDGRTFDRHTATLRDDGHNYLGRVWFFRDITERKVAERQIAQLARTDALTGLANRATFTERIEQAIAAHRRRGGVLFAVLYFDLDHFKDINDTLGHGIGDALLRQVAERLKATIRADDVAARLGGDEFAVLQPEVSDAAAVGLLAQRLITTLSKPYAIDGHDIRITASIGIAVDGMASAQEIMRNADLALYRAKDEGRNTYRIHTDEMDRKIRERVNLADELRAGLAAGQFTVYYQPQVDTRDGTITGVEALVRWLHPRRGVLLPSDFIPVAELTGLIAPLDKWVIGEACHQMQS